MSGNESLGFGWIVAQRTGGSIRPVGRTTETKYRKLAREAGVSLALGGVTSRRLDFETGTEVTGTHLLAQRVPA